MTEQPPDRYRVFDRSVQLTSFAKDVQDSLQKFDQLINVNPSEEEVLLRRWQKRCKTKTLANTSKQYFSNPGLLVLLRQYYESSHNANNIDTIDTQSYLNSPESVSNSLTSQFKGILDDMKSKPLGIYKRDARVSIPAHRRPDINYLSEQTKLRQEAISTSTSELPLVVITVTLFNPEKQHDRNEEVELLSVQAIGDLIAHIGCHAQSVTIDAEHQPEKVCFINDKIYTNATEMAAKERLYRSFYTGYDTSKMSDGGSITTKFNDIDIVFSQPNILSHNGKCRHVFMFKNARCIQLTNKEDESIFPRTTFRGRINRIKCQMCTVYPAERVIVEDVHCGDTPVMMCICCYDMFLTDTQGNLLRDIKELPYHKARMELDEGGDDMSEI